MIGKVSSISNSVYLCSFGKQKRDNKLEDTNQVDSFERKEKVKKGSKITPSDINKNYSKYMFSIFTALSFIVGANNLDNVAPLAAKTKIEDSAKPIEEDIEQTKTRNNEQKEIEPKIEVPKVEEPQKEETEEEAPVLYERELPEGTFLGVLEGKEGKVEELCREYGVESKLVAAIIGIETGWGNAGVALYNNPMSYRASGDLGVDESGFGIFSTPEAGLRAGIENLADYKIRYGIEAIDIDHIYEIGQIYCGDDYEYWVNSVIENYNYLSKQ